MDIRSHDVPDRIKLGSLMFEFLEKYVSEFNREAASLDLFIICNQAEQIAVKEVAEGLCYES